jgi:hypothetical protein
MFKLLILRNLFMGRITRQTVFTSSVVPEYIGQCNQSSEMEFPEQTDPAVNCNASNVTVSGHQVGHNVLL